MTRLLLLLLAEASLLGLGGAFSLALNSKCTRAERSSMLCLAGTTHTSPPDAGSLDTEQHGDSRRSFLTQASLLSTSIMLVTATSACTPAPAQAAVGSLPELADANAILQGVTIRVADPSQLKSTISFFTDAFDFKVLRKKIKGDVEETWLGYGPEQLSIPADCKLPPSSFATYGGHASIHVVYDSQSAAPLYRTGDAAPGDSIAFLQVAVPGYRISQMTKNSANILDAYGHINVVSPAGLQIRGIVGITPDPIMFVAVNCIDVQASKKFYQQLGFAEQEYPYARPSRGTGPFEPAQPASSVYMAPSPNCMGVLLLPTKSKRITQNPVFESLNLVYTPSTSTEGESAAVETVFDPSGIGVTFQSVPDFELEERKTR